MRRRDLTTSYLAAGALALSVLALGGGPRWAVCLIAIAALAAAASQITSQRRLTGRQPLLVLLAAAIGLTALQLIPLPVALVELLNPVGQGLRAGSLALVGDSPSSFAPLSLDPSSTRLELLELVTLFAVAWVGLRLSADSRGRTRVITAVALIAALAAVLAFAHQLLGLDELYGVYDLKQASPFYLGPLLNKNHQASLLALGASLSAGLVLRPELRRDGRVLWGACLLVCLVGCLLMKSRGGAIALAVGLGTTGMLWLAQRRPGERATSRAPVLLSALPAAIIVLCGLALAVHFSASGISSQLAATDLSAEIDAPMSKFMAWRSSEALIDESPWVGVGRGAFESAFTRIHPASARLTYAYLENEYLQAIVDWGLPGAIALAAIGVWLALRLSRRWNDGAVAAGALGGVFAVAAQSFVDFGIQLLGVAVPLVLVIAALLGKPLDAVSSSRHRRLTVVRGALLAAMAVAIVAVIGPWGRVLREDQELLRVDDPAARVAQARVALRRHPLDYFAAAQGATGLVATTDPAALRWLNWGMVLHPTHPGLHRLAARILRSTDQREQALVEYALAMRSVREPRILVAEILTAFPAAADAIRALPDGHDDPALLATTLVELGRPDAAIAYLERALASRGEDVALLRKLADLAEQQHDLPVAVSSARRLFEAEATTRNGLQLARALLASGSVAEAEKLLRALIARPGLGASENKSGIELLLAECLVRGGRWADARALLHGLRSRPGVDNATLIAIQQHLVTVEEKSGNAQQAVLEERMLRALGGR